MAAGPSTTLPLVLFEIGPFIGPGTLFVMQLQVNQEDLHYTAIVILGGEGDEEMEWVCCLFLGLTVFLVRVAPSD